VLLLCAVRPHKTYFSSSSLLFAQADVLRGLFSGPFSTASPYPYTPPKEVRLAIGRGTCPWRYVIQQRVTWFRFIFSLGDSWCRLTFSIFEDWLLPVAKPDACWFSQVRLWRAFYSARWQQPATKNCVVLCGVGVDRLFSPPQWLHLHHPRRVHNSLVRRPTRELQICNFVRNSCTRGVIQLSLACSKFK
jgi:hypothetical protein